MHSLVSGGVAEKTNSDLTCVKSENSDRHQNRGRKKTIFFVFFQIKPPEPPKNTKPRPFVGYPKSK
jgi:hypothetical protein